MGDSIGDILYIIIMVVIFVFSAIVKGKKAIVIDEAVPQSEKQDYPMSALDEWEEGDEDEVSTPVESRGYKKRVHPARLEKKRATHRKTYSPSQSKFGSKKSILTVEEETENPTWFGDPEDLRRAIIYSEILKRPSF